MTSEKFDNWTLLPFKYQTSLGWYAEFLLKIVIQFLLGKIAAKLIFKIMLKSLHLGPGIRIVMVVAHLVGKW